MRPILIFLVFFLSIPSCFGQIEPALELEEKAGLANVLLRHEPVYTPAAKSLKLSGRVALEVYVGKDGAVFDTVIAFGNPVLAEMASKAVMSWKFRPFLGANGQPAKATFRVSLDLSPPK